MAKSTNSAGQSGATQITPRPIVANSTRSSVDATPIQSGTIGPDKHSVEKARQRAQTRDQQIRKSAGLALSKQNRVPKTNGGKASLRKGEEFPSNAVANYELCEAETILESNTIVEAARHMAAKRLDFVLVVDGMGRLVGIVTDKDLAFRVVAENLDPRQITVAQVMTQDPQCVQSSLSMTDALTKMVQNHFRHLPVMEDEKVIGVLDIAKCLYDALQKLELADAAANQIAAALESVGKEFAAVIDKKGIGKGNNEALSYADTIRDCLSSPKLSSILDRGSDTAVSVSVAPAESSNQVQCTVVNVRCNVIQAVKQMKSRKETALLVTEDSGILCGIFTTKDVLLRVVAAGLDPATTSIVRVMTPHPDSATPDVSIVTALRQMHTGHYLHLPVLMSKEKTIVGVVDVLQLTYSMLEQLSSLKGADQAPLWHQLWSPTTELDPFGEASSLAGTASQYSEHRSDIQAPGLGGNACSHLTFAPRISTPTTDDFPHLNSNLVFKIKHAGSDDAILIPADNLLQLPGVGELEAEAYARFGVSRGALFLVDEEDDLIPIRDDAELSKFVQLFTSSGKDRINLLLLDRTSIAASPQLVVEKPKEASLPSSSSLAIIGGGLALVGAGLAALGFFLLKVQKASL